MHHTPVVPLEDLTLYIYEGAQLRHSIRSIVLEGNLDLLCVSAPRRPSVRADPQGMQPG